MKVTILVDNRLPSPKANPDISVGSTPVIYMGHPSGSVPENHSGFRTEPAADGSYLEALSNSISKASLEVNPDSELESEHGLSIFIETDGGVRILMDMGASGLFMKNAKRLGIDLCRLDFAVLSHGHSDHTGGLRPFLEAHRDISVLMSDKIFGYKYYSNRPHENDSKSRGKASMRDISTDQSIPSDFKEAPLVGVCQNIWLSPNIALITDLSGADSVPEGDSHLFMAPADEADNKTLDNFAHELALAIVSKGSLVIFSPCSHNGATNIIQACQRFTGIKQVKAFIGGLHLVQHASTKEEAESLGEMVSTRYPNTRFITGHCTCDPAMESLVHTNLRVENFWTGRTFEI